MNTFFTRLNFFGLLFFILGSSFAQTKVIPYQQLANWNGNSTGSNMFFGATMTSSGFTVTFAGPSDRYIALGLGGFMSPTDVLIYSSGNPSAQHTLSWKDYWNASSSGTSLDATQDWNIISTGVASGQRTVVASRALNTGDSNDAIVSFTASALSVVWAKNSIADYTIAYHGSTNRAYNISLPWLSTPTASFTAPSTTVCEGSSVTFSNLSTGGQTSYTWNFSGANLASSTATNPSVTYTAPGVYSVALTASNAVSSSSLSLLNYITVTPTVAPGISIAQTAGANPICSGALATFTASYTNGGPAPSFQWKVNGSNVGTNSSTLNTTSLPNPASVTCVMTSNSVCASPSVNTSAAITLTVNSSAPASIGISLNGGSNPMCNGATASFTATPGNGGNSPAYQWKVNNINVGSNSPTYSSSTLVNSDIVSCNIVSSASCASSPSASSAGITMTVSSVLVPSVAIALATGSNPSCAGSPITLTATPVNGGTAPSYQWKVNGISVGTNSSSYSSTTLSNGNVITCIMTSNSPCSNPTTGTSTAISLTVNPVPPTPIITPSGTITLCSGSPLVSSAATGNNWSTGATTQSIVVNSTGNYSVTQTVNGCTSLPSAVVHVSVAPSPTASLNSPGLLCANDSPVQLQGTPAGGTFSGPGMTGNNFDPAANGAGTFVIIYQYTDPNTCSDTSAVSISVSACLGVDAAKTDNSSVSVFPNPGSGVFTASANGTKIKQLRVFDMLGRPIITKACENENSISFDLSKEAPGIYILELLLEKQTIRKCLYRSE